MIDLPKNQPTAEQRVNDFIARLLAGEATSQEYDALLLEIPYELAARLQVAMRLMGYLYQKIKASLGE
jgi:hypothetical protein